MIVFMNKQYIIKAFRTIRKTVRDTTRDVSRGDMLIVRWYEIPVFIPN